MASGPCHDRYRKPDAVEAALPGQLVSDADHVSLSRLVVEIAWRIDHGQADRVWELFVPDGVLNSSGTPLAGHDAIRNWGEARIASTMRTRHICSGMRFIDRGNSKATGSTLLTVFMHDGGGRGPAVPAVVGEDTDEFIRTDVGWRFLSRTFETLFA
jgi:SnoaL-like domain